LRSDAEESSEICRQQRSYHCGDRARKKGERNLLVRVFLKRFPQAIFLTKKEEKGGKP
jgi:hypothetical protein